MNEGPRFQRPDLTGKTFGGVVLAKKIGGGGFGDVYISPDCKICTKVIFRGAFSSQESYERELNAVRFISSTLREHCGIAKFLGSGRTNLGFNYPEPFHPCGGVHTEDFRMYEKFPVIPDSMEQDCREWKEAQTQGQELFYYFMLAADNLEKAPEYCPDTLANRSVCKVRSRYGIRTGGTILKRMSEAAKIQVLAEIIDSLLFLYRLEVKNCSNWSRPDRKNIPVKTIFHVAHGDIKPGNIFFVNGHAQLGDMGVTLQIDPETQPAIGTSGFMPQGFQKMELEKKCGDNCFAYSVFSDIFALAETARYMMRNGKKDFGPIPFSRLSELVDILASFGPGKSVGPDNVVDRLASFRRDEFPFENRFRHLSHYGTTAPDIPLNDLYEFSRMWQIVNAESPNRFLVENKASQWGRYADILLAERYPAEEETEIRKKEADMLSCNKSDGLPLLIYQLRQTGEIIVLSHPFTPSEEARRELEDEISRARRR